MRLGAFETKTPIVNSFDQFESVESNIEYLKKIWINTKIKNEMASVDAQIKQLHEDWDEEERRQFSPEIVETPSEVDGLNDMSISFSSEEEDPS